MKAHWPFSCSRAGVGRELLESSTGGVTRSTVRWSRCLFESSLSLRVAHVVAERYEAARDGGLVSGPAVASQMLTSLVSAPPERHPRDRRWFDPGEGATGVGLFGTDPARARRRCSPLLALLVGGVAGDAIGGQVFVDRVCDDQLLGRRPPFLRKRPRETYIGDRGMITDSGFCFRRAGVLWRFLSFGRDLATPSISKLGSYS